MLEHPSSQQLKLYQRRALAPVRFLEVHRHVSACPSCSEQCDDPLTIEEDYTNLLDALMPEPGDEPYHLSQAELARYVEARLDKVDGESAESHLAVCADCSQAVLELRAGNRHDTLAPVTGNHGLEGHGPFGTAWAQLAAYFHSWHRPEWAIAFMLLALGLILTTLFFLYGRHDRPMPAANNNVRSGPSNANQREQLPSPPETGRAANGAENGTASEGTIEKPAGVEKPPGPNQSAPAIHDAGGSVQGGGPESELGALAAARLSASSQQAIRSALMAQRLERPRVLAELSGRSGTLLGESGDGRPFLLLSPVGKVVQNTDPTFRWKPLEGASHYIVTVTDEHLDQVATSGPLTKPEWKMASTLKRGRVYSWQVTAVKDGQAITSPVMPAPQAKFMVLDWARSEELKRARRAAPRYHLGLSVLYARAGLLDEAERELLAELKSNPRSVVARRLLHSVRSMKS